MIFLSLVQTIRRLSSCEAINYLKKTSSLLKYLLEKLFLIVGCNLWNKRLKYLGCFVTVSVNVFY